MRLFQAAALLGTLLTVQPADAQVVSTFDPGPLPTFARAERDATSSTPRWDGSYASLTSGFQVTSSKRFGTFAGPTIGFEGGKMLREGDFVYGVIGAFDYVAPFAGYGTPTFGRLAYTRDFAGVIQFKAGALLTEDVLLYAKIGAAAVNGTWRFGGSWNSTAFNRSDVAVVPDARVGVEWAVTDRLTLSVEVGRTGPALR